eukprot:TRINITY_DN21442_c0_g1_i1.p1 TRINITY_DN21442_c0_g1~~TRINITY_DN21442_c0_g1_i1.p1  ORF type:complete len:620 (+),score=65.17 TRINITY_DN21442_c0_g1_i1:117-1862(+)
MAVAHRDVAGLLRKRGYTELKKIGEGSFGKAILVQSDADGAKLVAKMVDVSSASQKEMQDAVKEGKLLAAFKHPYVVRYRESFIDTGWLCILMDYCEGGDLSKIIEQAKKRRQPIPEEQVLRWMTQALLALKYIHDKHVLHRDLKSSNFFLSKAGNLKMGDFGIAKVLSCTAACARTQIGTPYYLSPEVCQEKPYTWPSDIWAMGCIFFELCERKVPFDAANISGLVQKICRGPTPQISASSGYSDFVRQLCCEMLNRNPSQRPSAETILQRPRIQEVVRQMLDEAQAAQAAEERHREGREPDDSRGLRGDSGGPTAPLAPLPSSCGPYAESAGSYRRGDLVEYHSSTHKDWLPATVVTVDAEGRIVIDLKPNTWISRETQAAGVRPRRIVERKDPYHAPSAAQFASAAGHCPTPLRQRSPSVAGGGFPSRQITPLKQGGVYAQAQPSVGSRAGSRAGTPSGGGARRFAPRDPSPSPANNGQGSPSVRSLTPGSGPPSVAGVGVGGGGRAASPGGHGGFLGGLEVVRRSSEPPQVRPPGMPRPLPEHSGLPHAPHSRAAADSVLQRPCRAANAAGMVIAGV